MNTLEKIRLFSVSMLLIMSLLIYGLNWFDILLPILVISLINGIALYDSDDIRERNAIYIFTVLYSIGALLYINFYVLNKFTSSTGLILNLVIANIIIVILAIINVIATKYHYKNLEQNAEPKKEEVKKDEIKKDEIKKEEPQELILMD